jgi:hypothetical protein
MKTKILWVYIVLLHIVILILGVVLARAIQQVRADRQLPGSVLFTSYINIDDEQEWWHILNHESRDPVSTVKELKHGVAEITISPPGCSLVWYFYRPQGQEWHVVTADFQTAENANMHLSSRSGVPGTVDGPPFGILDGVSDANITID